MNDLLCFSFYDVWYEIVLVEVNVFFVEVYDVVGLVCEIGDIFVCECLLLCCVFGDLLMICGIGVYVVFMVFIYNFCLLVVEVLLDIGCYVEVCCWQSFGEMIVGEQFVWYWCII